MAVGTRGQLLRNGAAVAAATLLGACGTTPARVSRTALVGFVGVNHPTDADNVRIVAEFAQALRDQHVIDGRDIVGDGAP